MDKLACYFDIIKNPEISAKQRDTAFKNMRKNVNPIYRTIGMKYGLFLERNGENYKAWLDWLLYETILKLKAYKKGFKTYFYRVAYNAMINFLRNTRLKEAQQDLMTAECIDSIFKNDKKPCPAEASVLFWYVIDDLSPIHRLILQMYYEGYTQIEIYNNLGITKYTLDKYTAQIAKLIGDANV